MEVKLENFQGPMDLLLHLIRRSEIDIFDIPISQVTKEYLEIIAQGLPDMGEMSEFLVMAATLLEIKSKMLLPGAKKDEEPIEDPRETLARQLIAYEEAKIAALYLRDNTSGYGRLTGHPDSQALNSFKENDPRVVDLIPLTALADMFFDVMARQEKKVDTVRSGYGGVPRERFSVTQKVGAIIEALREKGSLSLRALFLSCRSKREMIVTFLALLEMVRRGTVKAAQQKAFGDVVMVSCPV